MPNSRRRRFSVQNDLTGHNKPKGQNGTQSTLSISSGPKNKEFKMAKNDFITAPVNVSRTNKLKNLVEKNSSITSTSGSSGNESHLSFITIRKYPLATNQEITASSIDIDKNKMKYSNVEISRPENKQMPVVPSSEREQRSLSRRRDKPRQHRIKVRSPRRKTLAMNVEINTPSSTCSDRLRTSEIGISTIDLFDEETDPDYQIPSLNELVIENVSVVENFSTHSEDDMCRICHGGESLASELGQLISACSCRGTVGRVHVKCLERWLTESGKSRCELCGTRYVTRLVHKYGFTKALVMWILSQNAKQLMVDSLGIMLMSPLAILAAWLSGKTLSGLMIQDSQITPWPLASTFVLACMTLVCYYCWIVSAATRHALGWWIWYRSQYEVRLQLEPEED